MFQNVLVNSSFLTLFITTLFYWFILILPNKQPSIIGQLGLFFTNCQLFAFFVLRWLDSHHFPLSNLYESLLFFSWSLTLCHFVIVSKIGTELIVGAITAPSALFLNAFASFTLPENLKIATPLVPALQSNWLLMHVTMMILSYSLLLLGSLFSIALLTLNSEDEQVSRLLDNLSYRTLGFGFPLLTIGILSGAVWANQAWGSYWSWDPKETWALITWIVFAIYFHFRLNQKWSGQKPALIASIGFVFLWVCYLGVNLLGKGLHSYGWF